MEYTIPYDEALPGRWQRAHNELSPPSSPAVDSAGVEVAGGQRIAKMAARMSKPSSSIKPAAAQGHPTKALTPPTSSEAARTAAVRTYEQAAAKEPNAATDPARDGDRSSSASPVPRCSSPTPAGLSRTGAQASGTVTPPPLVSSHRHPRQARVLPPPIRDTPNNPFLEGGPADLGFRGPFGADARIVADARAASRVQKGRTTYVFRGQRITYDDPDYVSGDSDSDGLFGPQGLQPRLLFPSQAPSRPADRQPASASSASRSGSRSRSRALMPSASAKLAASLAAHQRSLASRAAQEHAASASTHDQNGIDVDSYFGPSEVPQGRRVSQESKTRASQDAASRQQLLQRCDDWSSDASDEGESIGRCASSSISHSGFDPLERVRTAIEMDHLVALGEHPPTAATLQMSAGSVAMSRGASSRSSSSASSSRSAWSSVRAAPHGQGNANPNKRKAHLLWDRETYGRAGSVGTDGGDEAASVVSDSTGHTFGMGRISLSNSNETGGSAAKRSRLAGPEPTSACQLAKPSVGLGLTLPGEEDKEATTL